MKSTNAVAVSMASLRQKSRGVNKRLRVGKGSTHSNLRTLRSLRCGAISCERRRPAGCMRTGISARGSYESPFAGVLAASVEEGPAERRRVVARAGTGTTLRGAVGVGVK